MGTFVFPEANKCQANRKAFLFEQKECAANKQEKGTIYSDWKSWKRSHERNVDGLEE
jgi:hypothetical protein